ncbi:MAG: hypothetical protein GXP49_14405 [Deltaproteobacteria bacterium]|nr:hypothetical protein [Deltaproteobacteria bacterium]
MQTNGEPAKIAIFSESKKHATIALFILWQFLGCGVKAPPRPITNYKAVTTEVPVRYEKQKKSNERLIHGLRAFVKPGVVVVAWQYPGNRIHKKPKLHFLLQRKLVTGKNIHAQGKKFMLVRDLDLANPGGARLTKNQVEVLDFDLEPGTTYEYRVVPRLESGRLLEPSKVIRVEIINPPGPPSDIKASPGDKNVTISWKPPIANKTKIEGYHVYRLNCITGERQSLSDEPVKGTSFLDIGLRNNHEYCYEVTALSKAGQALIEGRASVRVSIVPRDLVAPPPPGKVRIRRSGRETLIEWEPVKADDLLGYKVYRRNGQAGQAVCLTPKPIKDTRFVDKINDPGYMDFIYFITSVDNAPSRNESPPSREIDFKQSMTPSP